MIIEEHKPSIVCLVETFLADITSEENDDEEQEEGNLTTLRIEGYEIIRKDRKHKYGGGCIVAYHKEIENLVTEIDTDEKNFEAQWISIGNSITKVNIAVVYFPGENSPLKTREAAYIELQQQIQQHQSEEIIIIGDFNAKLQTENQEESPSGKLLNNFIANNDMTPINFT